MKTWLVLHLRKKWAGFCDKQQNNRKRKLGVVYSYFKQILEVETQGNHSYESPKEAAGSVASCGE